MVAGRSSTEKMAGGVCGGLAQHTGIDSLVWRVGLIALTVAGGASGWLPPRP